MKFEIDYDGQLWVDTPITALIPPTRKNIRWLIASQGYRDTPQVLVTVTPPPTRKNIRDWIETQSYRDTSQAVPPTDTAGVSMVKLSGVRKGKHRDKIRIMALLGWPQ